MGLKGMRFDLSVRRWLGPVAPLARSAGRRVLTAPLPQLPPLCFHALCKAAACFGAS
jgi:hypothetical protein